MQARVLRQGMQGDDVVKWQNFLIGQGFFQEAATGSFTAKTTIATIEFQQQRGLLADGIVGDRTYGAAMARGYGLVEDHLSDDSTKNWPPIPTFGPVLTTAERERMFGSFSYVPAPSIDNPEGIRITSRWANESIVKVSITQLKEIAGAPYDGMIYFHKAGQKQLTDLWNAWEEHGLLPLVKTWGGSWVPRFIRGSRTVLSNHAFGTAFDINASYNPMGTVPQLTMKNGSVRKLVPLANAHGFYWGGHFPSRPDGMHFELAVIK